MLLAGPAPSGAAIARQVGLKQPSVVRILRDLDRRGYIARSGRSVALTDAGRTEAQRIERDRNAAISRSMLRLAVEEKARLSDAIAAMAGTHDTFGSGIANAIRGYDDTFRGSLFSASTYAAMRAYGDASRAALFSPALSDTMEQYNAISKDATLASAVSDAVGLAAKASMGSALGGVMEKYDYVAGLAAKGTVGNAFADIVAGLDLGKIAVGSQFPDIAGLGLGKVAIGHEFADIVANMPSMKYPGMLSDIERLTGVTKGMASALAAHELAVTGLTNSALRGLDYADVFADTTPVLSRMIADLGAVSRLESAPMFQRIAQATDRLAESHGTLFAASLDWLGPLGRPSQAARQMAWSTLAAGSGVSAARASVSPEDDDPVEAAVDAALDAVASALHSELEAIDPYLASMLNGALDARTRGGPDWHRHMAQSLRTLMTSVLDLRAPRSVVKARLGNDDQRRRLQYVMGGRTAAAFAEGAIGMFTVTWSTLSAEAKTARAPRFTQAGAIQLIAMYCHLLRLMLGAPTLEDDEFER